MVGDYKLLRILDSLRTAVMYDGRVTLGETSVILRTIRPFVLKGEPGAAPESRGFIFGARAGLLKGYDVATLLKYPGK